LKPFLITKKDKKETRDKKCKKNYISIINDFLTVNNIQHLFVGNYTPRNKLRTPGNTWQQLEQALYQQWQYLPQKSH
jgi:hypothetical protein